VEFVVLLQRIRPPADKKESSWNRKPQNSAPSWERKVFVASLSRSVEKIKHCLDQLDEEQLWWRPHESMNSIANLILHL
jgi:hypothetical protein